jgi:hypothetical protein
MSRQAARLAILCLVLTIATTGTAAGGDAAAGWSRPGLVREMVWDWIARLVGVQAKCSMGIDPNGKPCGTSEIQPECSGGIDPDGKPCPTPEVQLKCSGGIDPNGAPCVMPSAGCRCVP